MTKPALIAQITGEAYHHMLDWRNEVDLTLIQAELDNTGEALVITLEPDFGMEVVTTLPAPGTARPHSSPFGGGFEYCFFHTPAGWMLKVTNTTQRSFRFEHITPIPPLVIDDSSGVNVALQPAEDMWWDIVCGLQDDSGDMPIDRTAAAAQFSIKGEMYERLLNWGWTPEQLTTYQYSFLPLSVGCEVMVDHPGSGRRNHLTEDVCW
jgi:hypothetical protein